MENNSTSNAHDAAEVEQKPLATADEDVNPSLPQILKDKPGLQQKHEQQPAKVEGLSDPPKHEKDGSVKMESQQPQISEPSIPLPRAGTTEESSANNTAATLAAPTTTTLLTATSTGGGGGGAITTVATIASTDNKPAVANTAAANLKTTMTSSTSVASKHPAPAQPANAAVSSNKKRKLSSVPVGSTSTTMLSTTSTNATSSANNNNMNATGGAINNSTARSGPITPPLVDYPIVAQAVNDIFALLQTYGPLTYAQLEYNLPPLSGGSGRLINHRSLSDILELLVAIGLVQKVQEDTAATPSPNTRYCMLQGIPRADVVHPSTVLDQIEAAHNEIKRCQERTKKLEAILLGSSPKTHRELLKSLVAEYPEVLLDPVYVAALRNLHVDIGGGSSERERKVRVSAAAAAAAASSAAKSTTAPTQATEPVSAKKQEQREPTLAKTAVPVAAATAPAAIAPAAIAPAAIAPAAIAPAAIAPAAIAPAAIAPAATAPAAVTTNTTAATPQTTKALVDLPPTAAKAADKIKIVEQPPKIEKALNQECEGNDIPSKANDDAPKKGLTENLDVGNEEKEPDPNPPQSILEQPSQATVSTNVATLPSIPSETVSVSVKRIEAVTTEAEKGST